jgi:hypothetical protein
VDLAKALAYACKFSPYYDAFLWKPQKKNVNPPNVQISHQEQPGH